MFVKYVLNNTNDEDPVKVALWEVQPHLFSKELWVNPLFKYCGIASSMTGDTKNDGDELLGTFTMVSAWSLVVGV